MGIRYEQDTPLKEYMGVYQIPATLADCVEQYRLDCIQNVDQNTKISELDYSLIIDPGQQGYDNAFALYDPLGYFGDTTLSALPPKTTASIPPLPARLIRSRQQHTRREVSGLPYEQHTECQRQPDDADHYRVDVHIAAEPGANSSDFLVLEITHEEFALDCEWAALSGRPSALGTKPILIRHLIATLRAEHIASENLNTRMDRAMFRAPYASHVRIAE